jgi:hypothetical protein
MMNFGNNKENNLTNEYCSTLSSLKGYGISSRMSRLRDFAANLNGGDAKGTFQTFLHHTHMGKKISRENENLDGFIFLAFFEFYCVFK